MPGSSARHRSGGPDQERQSYKHIVLEDRLLTSLKRINPHIPDAGPR